MFKNLKIASKISTGMAVLILATLLVAFVGWNSLSKTTVRVKNSEDACFIIQQALKGRQSEKNFIIRGDDSYIVKADESAAEVEKLAASLTARLKDTADIEATQKTTDQLHAWQDALKSYVRLEQEKKQAETAMVENAGLAVAEAEKMRADQKEKLAKELESSASAERIKDRLSKADDANRVIKLLADAKGHRLMFMMRQQEEAFKGVHEYIDKAVALNQEMIKGFKDQANIDQANAGIEAIQTYINAFDKYAECVKSQKEEEESMVNAARELEALASKLLEGQKEKTAQGGRPGQQNRDRADFWRRVRGYCDGLLHRPCDHQADSAMWWTV